MNKVKFLIMFILFFCLYVCQQIEIRAESIDSSELNFKLDTVVDFYKTKMLTIEVVNNGENSYSYGWVSDCNIVVITDQGKYSKILQVMPKILPGVKKYKISINAPGTIKNIKINGILLLNERGLPVSTGVGEHIKGDFDVNVNQYLKIKGLNCIIVTVGLVAGFIIFINKFNRKRGVYY